MDNLNVADKKDEEIIDIVNIIKQYKNVYVFESNYNIKFIYKDRKDIFVDADKARIIQVISNLLCNSIKFTNEGAIITTVEKKDSYAIVSV